MLFRLTNSVLERFKDFYFSNENAENRYCEWICDSVTIERKHYFFVSNSYSMVSVIFPAKGISSFERFCTVCNAEIKRICETNGWENLYNKYISDNCKSNFAAKTWNRSFTAKMNHEKMYLDQIYKLDGRNLSEVEKYINRDIMKNLGDSKDGYGTPRKVFVSDFMKLPVTTPEIKTPKQKAPKIYFQFYTQLEDFSTKIWRRFIIDSNEKMSTLGSLLITLFEAQGGHLYEFSFDNSKKYEQMLKEKGITKKELNKNHMFESLLTMDNFIVSIPDEESFDSKPYFLDIEGNVHIKPKEFSVFDTKIRECFKENGDECTFSYDFGDGWQFTVKLEKIFQNEETKAPCAIEGEGYGIFEDIGGTYALEEVYKQFKNKRGEMYDSISDWLEEPDKDLSVFDMDAMNKNIKSRIRIFNQSYKQPW